MLTFLFWSSGVLLFWTFFGYPTWMLLRGRRQSVAALPNSAGAAKVSVVLAVRNGAKHLAARVDNLLTQAYPPELLEVLVVVNGSTDGSRAIADGIAASNTDRVRVLESAAEQGKAGALNLGVQAAAGDAIVFADVRQRFAPDTVARLSSIVMQPGVGAVSGRLEIASAESGATEGMRRYWSLETELRLAESRTGSVMGVTGAIYAIRREAFFPIPPGTLLDDVYLPLRIALSGRRVLLDPASVAYDEPSATQGSEYRRRVRTLLGNLQLVQLMPELLRPWRNPVFFRFLSHKLLRVFSPLFLIALLVSGLLLDGLLYRGIAYAELTVLALGAAGLAFAIRPLALPAAMLMVNVAALEAMFRPRRRAHHVWHA